MAPRHAQASAWAGLVGFAQEEEIPKFLNTYVHVWNLSDYLLEKFSHLKVNFMELIA